MSRFFDFLHPNIEIVSGFVASLLFLETGPGIEEKQHEKS